MKKVIIGLLSILGISAATAGIVQQDDTVARRLAAVSDAVAMTTTTGTDNGISTHTGTGTDKGVSSDTGTDAATTTIDNDTNTEE